LEFDVTESKRCPDCGETKPAAEWGKNKRVIDGLAAYCSACVSIRNRAQYVKNQARRIAEAASYREANAEAIVQRERKRHRSPKRRAWRKAHREANRERLMLMNRAWKAAHPNYDAHWRANNPSRLDYERQHREANREMYRQWARARRAKSPEIARRAKHKRRAALASNGHVPYSSEQLLQKLDYWGWKCWICGDPVTPGRYHLDHVKPINKGGMDCLSNIRPACGHCNQSKQDRWPFEPPLRSTA